MTMNIDTETKFNCSQISINELCNSFLFETVFRYINDFPFYI